MKNQRITLRKPNRTADGFGGQTTDYVDYGVWATVEEREINKTFSDGSTVYGKRFEIKFRNHGALKDFTPEWRITYRTQNLEVVTFTLDENRTVWTILAEYAD